MMSEYEKALHSLAEDTIQPWTPELLEENKALIVKFLDDYTGTFAWDDVAKPYEEITGTPLTSHAFHMIGGRFGNDWSETDEEIRDYIVQTYPKREGVCIGQDDCCICDDHACNVRKEDYHR